jgi:prevent-host-death family protein
MAMPARRIGIREARSHFGDLIQAVKQGAEWVITDHGRPVAKLTAIGPEALSLTERIQAMEEAGRITPPPKDSRRMPPPLPLPEGVAQKLLQEDRDR